MIQLFCLNIMNFIKIVFFYFFNIIFLYPQDTKSILTNLDIQIEATAAINKMYNFNFDEADKEFNWLVQEYKDHPLPIFLKGLSVWWKIDANSGLSDIKENKEIKKLDNIFLDYMDKSISLSKKIYDVANSNSYLIIISPNPLTYLLFPLKEFFNFLYCQIIYKYKS